MDHLNLGHNWNEAPHENVVLKDLKLDVESKGAGKLLASDADGNITCVDAPSSLPSGTIDGGVIRWNHSNNTWEENIDILVNPSFENKQLNIKFGEYYNSVQYGLFFDHLGSDNDVFINGANSSDGDTFRVYANGKINSLNLAGTGSAPLEATSNGTIQRTTGFTGTRVVNGETWTFEHGILKSIV